jgi:uncharacterized protein (DUF342 family)
MLDSELIRLSDDRSYAEVRLTPNSHGPLTVSNLHALLASPTFNQLFPLTDVIEDAVTQINQRCGQEKGIEELTFTLAQRCNAQVEIILSGDCMQAEMQLTAAWGGDEITMPDILAELKASNVQMGVDSPQIISQLKQVSQLAPGQQNKTIIARGKPAVNGNDAKLERKVPLARERLLQPQLQKDGSVDMLNLGAIIMVKPNDLLIEKIPADKGCKGYNVQGKELLPKPGKDKTLQPGEGTILSPHDPLKLIATAVGLPVEVNDSLYIDDVLTIKEVDVGYGHVSFKGSILITGDVHAGMIVKSTGDITVMGFVDSATLEAGGDITVSQGIIGRQLPEHELTTKISAQGQISAKFVQYAQLEAVGDISITKQLLHCNTKTQGMLTVCDKSNRRGELIGGIAHTEKGLKAVVVGATSGTKTEIYCAMKELELKQSFQTLKTNLTNIIELDKSLENRIGRIPPRATWLEDPVMIAQIRMMLHEKKRVTQQRINEEMELQQLQQELEQYYKIHCIAVSKCIFENVELNIGSASTRTQREYVPCRVFNQDKTIMFDYATQS